MPNNIKVLAVALNYQDEYAAYQDNFHKAPHNTAPKTPVWYIKTPNTYNANGKNISIPLGHDKIKCNASLGVVIGKSAFRLNAENAMDYVEYFTIVNDVNLPFSSYYRPAVREQCGDGFCVIGEQIPKNKIANPQQLAIKAYIDDQLVAQSNTSLMRQNIVDLLVALTEFTSLNAGDILLTGSPNMNLLLGDKQTICFEIEQLGKICNPIHAEVI